MSRPDNRSTITAALTAAVTLFGTTVMSGAPADAEEGRSAKVNRVLRDQRINESSGLAASTRFPGVLYTHEDSGGGPYVYAIGRRGQTRATFKIRGAGSRDWEDIAYGPRRTIWIGDIGDNRAVRDTIQVYRVREPGKLTSRDLRATQFELRYPDGSHDAEALLIHPRSGRLYVVSKQRHGAAVYQAPRRLDPERVNRLKKIRSAPELVTGGDLARDGRMLLRKHNHAFVYPRLHGKPSVFRLPDQPQGESAAFSWKDGGLLFGSERVNSKVYRVEAR